MPRPKQTVSASNEFSCSASDVWRVLTRENSYGEWFGYPLISELSLSENGFTTGARFSVNNMSTLVVTELSQDRKISLSNNTCRLSFEITPYDEFVDLTITLDILADNNPFDSIENLQLFLREALRKLKQTIGIPERYTGIYMNQPVIQKKPPLVDFLTRVFAGYRPPIITENKTNADEVFSSIIDNTEAAITIGKRALLVAVVLVCFFFMSISVALSFQRSDIVPSSGLSLFESENVNKYVSTLLRVGDEKQHLEARLSCQGERKVNADSSVEFHYASLDKDIDGEALERIYVIYDAYGRVRRYAYINVVQSVTKLYREPSNGKLREDMNYYELNDKNILLSPSMHLYEVEEIIGVPVSAYTVDKNGDSFITTYYFGEFYAPDIFNCNYKSQIMVTLNDVTGVTTVSYYTPVTEDNALPLDELSRTLRRQYAGLADYLTDRFAYERIFLLQDSFEEQVSLILDSKGIPVSLPISSPEQSDEETDIDIEEIEEQPTEQIELPLHECYIYRTANPADPAGSIYRSFYRVEYIDSLISSVSYRNTRLGGYDVD
ncbi:MAG: hypothetical protein FWG21_03710, partial [Oscillospiraceae bacterium]|nr:hypothetical protein [Oscillospiraceae bacterium]